MDESEESANDVPTPDTRGLHRSATKRLVAGVAGGIGERFDVDPNIVRVVFVVLTCLWGLGAAIYLAMWALIPRDPTAAVEPDDGHRLPLSTSRWPYVALFLGTIVLALIFVSTVGGVPRFGTGLVLLWLVFLVVLSIISLRVPARRLTLRRLTAVLFLAAVSLVIVVSGAFLGFLLSTGVPLSGGNGVRTWQPTSLTQVRHTYRTEFGKSAVNLSNVRFPTSGYSVSATVGVGNLVVELPSNAVVELKTHVGVGSVSYQVAQGFNTTNQFEAVPSVLKTVQSQLEAPHVTIDAEVGIGQILIVRAPVK